MSLFPRFTQEFSPIFRLIDDYDRATRQLAPSLDTTLRSFSPRFDVKELKDSYELHGELPGIDQKDVAIEWTDGNTLTISGRTEKYKESGPAPSSKDEAPQASGAIQGEVKEGETALTTSNGNKEVGHPAESQAKFWVSERSVGEFHRSFSFPTRVDQEAVKASLKNGILSIVVPKAAALKPKKIEIQ